jgi:hypothetical protein
MQVLAKQRVCMKPLLNKLITARHAANVLQHSMLLDLLRSVTVTQSENLQQLPAAT